MREEEFTEVELLEEELTAAVLNAERARHAENLARTRLERARQRGRRRVNYAFVMNGQTIIANGAPYNAWDTCSTPLRVGDIVRVELMHDGKAGPRGERRRANILGRGWVDSDYDGPKPTISDDDRMANA